MNASYVDANRNIIRKKKVKTGKRYIVSGNNVIKWNYTVTGEYLWSINIKDVGAYD